MTITSYRNGNYDVTMSGDGTKTREWDGEPIPEFPESVDMKVTDWCDGGCPWCHEESTDSGKHTKVRDVVGLILGLPAGVEIAIGGGDPLSHPNIHVILSDIARAGLIANVTINARHIARHLRDIREYRKRGWIHGLGVSWVSGCDGYLADVEDENTVVHFIAGLHELRESVRVSQGRKILILGYKRHGRGREMPFPANSINRWAYWIGKFFRAAEIVSFDNLALVQLGVQDRITAELWSRHYMGDDGRFTMYVDAVKMEYAASSVSHRVAIGTMTIREAFAELRRTMPAIPWTATQSQRTG